MTTDINTLEFVAFDTETTGLRPHSESLVEVAAVRFRLDTGPAEYFQTLVNPRMPIPWQATQVHGITDEMVAQAPGNADVLPRFFRFLEGAIPVAHNAPFDIGFLSLAALRAGLTPPDAPVLDTCPFSRRVCRELPSHKLESLVREFRIETSTFHRALADAISCMQVFRELVSRSCGIHAGWDELVQRHGKLHSFLDGSRKLDFSLRTAHFERLSLALDRGKPLWIQYEGNFGPREVAPLLLYAKGSQQYMEATCHLDGIRKSFRLDRILQVYETPAERN
jgi:DNA polymerase-3 subunit epsilon